MPGYKYVTPPGSETVHSELVSESAREIMKVVNHLKPFALLCVLCLDRQTGTRRRKEILADKDFSQSSQSLTQSYAERLLAIALH